jgi:hypothetical protein
VIRRAALALGLALALAGVAWAQPGPEYAAVIQHDFDLALRLEASGQLPQAITVLARLERRTDAPRVKLELARMLFHAGEYRDARSMFGKVYRQPLPYPVRRRINLYLDDIDQRIGYLRPTVGLLIDENPDRQPKSGIYEVLGAPLLYTNTAERAYVAKWRLDGLLPLARRDHRQWQIRATADGFNSDRKGVDQAAGEVSLRRAQLDQRAHLAMGWRGSDAVGLKADAAFVEYQRLLTPAPNRQWTLFAGLEVNRLAGLDLDGETARVSVSYARDLGSNTTLQLGGGSSVSSIEDPRWPSVTVSSQAALVRSMPRRNLTMVAAAGIAGASFEGKDLFFGKERQDMSANLQLAAYRGQPVFGFFPGIVVSQEARRSNIAFFDYDRFGVSMDFRRRF